MENRLIILIILMRTERTAAVVVETIIITIHNEGETVDVFGGDVWSSGAVLIVVLAWMFKAATERCTC